MSKAAAHIANAMGHLSSDGLFVYVCVLMCNVHVNISNPNDKSL